MRSDFRVVCRGLPKHTYVQLCVTQSVKNVKHKVAQDPLPEFDLTPCILCDSQVVFSFIVCEIPHEASSRMSRYPLYNDSFWNSPMVREKS